MKILVFAVKPPYPLSDGYNLHLYHYIKKLSNRHEFFLLSWFSNQETPLNILKSLFSHIKMIPRFPSTPLPLYKKIKYSFSIYSLYDYYPIIEITLKQLIKVHNFDIIWLAGWETFFYISCIKDTTSTPILGDIIDDPVLYHLSLLKKSINTTVKNKIITLRNILNFIRFEKKFFPLADKCMLVSEVDANFLKKICPQVDFVVLPNGVDITYFKPSEIEEEFTLVFEGNMAYTPNEDAVIYFCKKIFPLVKRKIPKVKFFIIGKNPTLKVKEMAQKMNGIYITGYVSDIRQYVGKASVFICPIRSGTGVKNKILQAWAMAKPVIATSASLGGLKVDIGKNILVADTPEAFANMIISLLNNKAKRKQLGYNGRLTVERYYSWEKKSEELEIIFYSLLKRKKYIKR